MFCTHLHRAGSVLNRANMARHFVFGLLGFLALFLAICSSAQGAISPQILSQAASVNSRGPYYGIVTTSMWKINPLLESGSFEPDAKYPYINAFGRVFRIGQLQGKRVIIVSSGSGLLNSGQTVQLLQLLFKIKAVVLYGSAGNANPGLQIGDVTIAREWADTGVWDWQRSDSNETTPYGHLKFSNFNNPDTVNGVPVENSLDKVSFQEEEVLERPEVARKVFWVRSSKALFKISKQLEGVELEQCVDPTNCLPRKPLVVRGGRGVSSNILVNNIAYRDFLYSKFDATSIDTTTIGASLVCRELNMACISIRALSNSASGAYTDESEKYGDLVNKNLSSWTSSRCCLCVIKKKEFTRYLSKAAKGACPDCGGEVKAVYVKSKWRLYFLPFYYRTQHKRYCQACDRICI